MFGLATFFATWTTSPTIYGTAPFFAGWSGGETREVGQQGCLTCLLVRVFDGVTELRRFKRITRNVSVVPYCGTCLTYPPED
jgi:hypothetical protein